MSSSRREELIKQRRAHRDEAKANRREHRDQLRNNIETSIEQRQLNREYLIETRSQHPKNQLDNTRDRVQDRQNRFDAIDGDGRRLEDISELQKLRLDTNDTSVEINSTN